MLFFAGCLFAGVSSSALPGYGHKGIYFKMPSNVAADDYLPNKIIFKVKEQFRSNCSAKSINNLSMLNMAFLEAGATTVEKMFPNDVPPTERYNAYGQEIVDLSLVYSMVFNSAKYNVEGIVNKMFSTGIFEYVQPYYIPKVMYTPNDPQLSQQWHITKINCQQGWDISKGNASVVIGIVDTGWLSTHSDLSGNVYVNTADPVNGVDDDGDGYIDNNKGWDVAMNDNDATWQGNNHGVHVCGCAAAHTDNANGVCAPGFNCKFMPVKIADASGALIAGYQGIKYAADRGCQIINNSWGGPGAGPYEQSIIDYAVINKNSTVIASAGNSNLDEKLFPASLNNVYSVAASSSSDAKSSFSTYHYTVDVTSPGSQIRSTVPTNGYAAWDGTSMAGPVAAGVAAVIKVVFPSYNATQVGEHLKATCDNHYGVNGSYLNKLGWGRINMYKALSTTTANAKSIVFEKALFTDNSGDDFLTGDTIRLSGDFVNYLAPSGSSASATVSVAAGGTYLQLQNTSFSIGALATLGKKNNASTPFTAKIIGAPPANQMVTFKVTITDGSFTKDYFLDLYLNVDYINIAINDVATTITSKGRIGYNLEGQQQGLGFTYKGDNLMYESSMMVGSSSTAVSDMFREGSGTGNNDFGTVNRVVMITPPVKSNFDVTGVYNDNPSTAKVGVQVRHNAYAWTSTGNRKFVIVEYHVKNISGGALSNMFVGIVTDWDVMDYSKNKVGQDNTTKMGYAYSTETNGKYAGTKLLTGGPFVHYGIDNISGGGGGIDPSTTFTTALKYTALSTNRATAGGAGTGNDVMDCVSSGPFNINNGDSVTVAFALIAGDDLNDLIASAGNAQILYNGLVGVNNYAPIAQMGMTVFPNPASVSANIQFYVPADAKGDLKLFDVSGREIAVLLNSEMNAGLRTFTLDATSLSNGIYFVRLTIDGNSVTEKLIINKN